MERQCGTCGKTFEVGRHQRKFCSPKCAKQHTADCRRQWRKENRKLKDFGERQCVICGKKFQPMNHKQLCCSKECGVQRSRDTQRQYREKMRELTLSARAIIAKRKCVVCGRYFETARRNQICCSPGCSELRAKLKASRSSAAKLEYLRKRDERAASVKAARMKAPPKPLSDWIREAGECGMTYGMYRTAVEQFGRSYEDLKQEHSHCGG